MPVAVVVGGQYGSEGKGKISKVIAKWKKATMSVRVGGINSGHTAYDDHGKKHVLRMLPTSSLLPGVQCVLPAGSYIDAGILLKEIESVGLADDMLIIDPNAVSIDDFEEQQELNWGISKSIGSTGSGTGAGVMSRVRRDPNGVCFARDVPALRKYIRPVVPVMRKALDNGEWIVVEGTQGFMLSLLHSPHYPYVTGRDTTAAAFVSEAGLSPLDVKEVVMVLRVHPIRVSGNSGPLPNEIDWDTVTKESGRIRPIIEMTSVTKKIRRVARFDAEAVKMAIEHERPTIIALNHIDYIDPVCLVSSGHIPTEARRFIDRIENEIGRNIDIGGFSDTHVVFPHPNDAKWRHG
jgi:adenylosuccinate synthase